MEPNQEGPIDLSLRKSIDSGEPDNPEELILGQAIDMDEPIPLRRASALNGSSDTNKSGITDKSLSQSIDSDELIYVDEPSGRFKRFCRRAAMKIIRPKMLSLAELSPTYVEHKIRGLQNYRNTYYSCSPHCSINNYTTELLPSTLALWCFEPAILRDEYYQELVNTLIFLAEDIGCLKMIEKVIENLIDMENYIPSGDRADLVKKQCHKITVDTIEKMMSMSDFNPTEMSKPVKKALTNIIREHRNEAIQDPVMLAGINTIVKKLNISE